MPPARTQCGLRAHGVAAPLGYITKSSQRRAPSPTPCPRRKQQVCPMWAGFGRGRSKTPTSLPSTQAFSPACCPPLPNPPALLSPPVLPPNPLSALSPALPFPPCPVLTRPSLLLALFPPALCSTHGYHRKSEAVRCLARDGDQTHRTHLSCGSADEDPDPRGSGTRVHRPQMQAQHGRVIETH